MAINGIRSGDLIVARAFLGSPTKKERPSFPRVLNNLPLKLNAILSGVDNYNKGLFLNQFNELGNDLQMAFLHWFSNQSIQRQTHFIQNGELISDIQEIGPRLNQERAIRLSCVIHQVEQGNSHMYPWESFEFIKRSIPLYMRSKIYEQLDVDGVNHVTKLCFQLNEIDSDVSESYLFERFNSMFSEVNLTILRKDFMVVSTPFKAKDYHVYDNNKLVKQESFDYTEDTKAYRCIGALTNKDNEKAGFFLFTILPGSNILHEDLMNFRSDVSNALLKIDISLRHLCRDLGLTEIHLTADHIGRYQHAKRQDILFFNRNDANRLVRSLCKFLGNYEIPLNDVWVGNTRVKGDWHLRRLINQSPLSFTQLKWGVGDELLNVNSRSGYDRDGEIKSEFKDLPLSKAFLTVDGYDNSWRGKIMID